MNDLIAPNLQREAPCSGLDPDPDNAAAQILVAMTGDMVLPADAFKTLAERNRRLVEAPAGEIRESLARQALLLENLWLYYAQKAVNAPKADHAALLVKASLNCQRALNQTLAALHTLDREERDAAAIDASAD